MGRPKARRPFPKGMIPEQDVQSVSANIKPLPKMTLPQDNTEETESNKNTEQVNMSAQKIRDLLSKKWDIVLQDRYIKELRLYQKLVDGIKANISSGNFQAINELEMCIYLNDIDTDSLTLNKLIPEINKNLENIGVIFLSGSFAFADGVSVLQCYIRVMN